MSNDGFTQVPNEVLKDNKLSSQARFLYSLLQSYAWTENTVFPGQDTLGSEMGVSSKTVAKYLKELHKNGYISWKRRGLNKTNLYTLSKWVSPRVEGNNLPFKNQQRNPVKNSKQLPNNNTKNKNTKDEGSSTTQLTFDKNASLQEMIVSSEPVFKEVSLTTGVTVPEVRGVFRKMIAFYQAEGKTFKDWKAKLIFWILRDIEDGKLERDMFVVEEAKNKFLWGQMEKVIAQRFGINWRENKKLGDFIVEFLKTNNGYEAPLSDLRAALDRFGQENTTNSQ